VALTTDRGGQAVTVGDQLAGDQGSETGQNRLLVVAGQLGGQ
jgi:hypothetical protein